MEWLVPPPVGVFAGGFLAARGLISGIFRLADPGYAPISLLADIPVEHGDGVLDATGNALLVHADTLSTGAVWLLAIADVVLGPLLNPPFLLCGSLYVAVISPVLMSCTERPSRNTPVV